MYLLGFFPDKYKKARKNSRTFILVLTQNYHQQQLISVKFHPPLSPPRDTRHTVANQVCHPNKNDKDCFHQSFVFTDQYFCTACSFIYKYMTNFINCQVFINHYCINQLAGSDGSQAVGSASPTVFNHCHAFVYVLLHCEMFCVSDCSR